jgi:integrase
MAVLAECPICHKKQSVRNKMCRGTKKIPCGLDLDKAKQNNTKTKKVKFWISYRVNGKQRREFVGYSIEEARDADGKRRVQKRENRIFEILPEAKMTFSELTKWYLGLDRSKPLADPGREEKGLQYFNQVFGDMVVADIKLEDLETYQSMRIKKGHAHSYIDQDLNYVKHMINKAFQNDKVGAQTLKAFNGLKGLLERGSNARNRTLSFSEYLALMKECRPHVKPMIQTLYYTGMRPDEVKALKWSRVDLKEGFIRLRAEDTKRNKPRSIPISDTLAKTLNALPRSLTGYVFTYRGKPVYYINGTVKKACQRADIVYGKKVEGGFILKDIRRTVKTNMLAAGVDPAYRNILLGHSLKGMDVHYLKPSEADLERAMGQYTAWLEDKIRGVDQTVDQTGTESS